MDPENSVPEAVARVAELLREPEPKEQAAPIPADAEGPRAQEEGDAVEAVAELLGEKPAEPAQEPAEPAEALTLAQAAEKLGVDPKELYGLRVGLPGGEELTLGQIKDLALAHKKDTAERLAWQQDREVERAALVTQHQELRELVAMVPPQMLTPQALATARARIEQAQQGEAQKLLQRVPEWRDRASYQADREVMNEHIKSFGFETGELDGIYDARLLAYIRHNALRERQLRAALEDARARKARQAGPASPTSKGDTASNRPQRGPKGQIEQVARILRGER